MNSYQLGFFAFIGPFALAGRAQAAENVAEIRSASTLRRTAGGERRRARSTFARRLNLLFALAATLVFAVRTAEAQIYVTNGGPVGEYTTAGATINASLVPGAAHPWGIAVSGGDLFISNPVNGTIGEYDATTGATINASLVSGLDFGWNIAVSGGDLFVVSEDSKSTTRSQIIGEYDATTGATINASLISGLAFPNPFSFAVSGGDIFVIWGNTENGGVAEFTTTGAPVNFGLVRFNSGGPRAVAVSGGDLFVATLNLTGTIGEYTTTGATVNASLIALGPDGPYDMAVSGGDLFVVLNEEDGGTIAEYDATTGAVINKSLVSGLSGPICFAINQVPEPSPAALLGLAAVGFAASRRRRVSGCPSNPLGPSVAPIVSGCAVALCTRGDQAERPG